MVKIIYPDEQDELVKAAGQLSYFFDNDGPSMKKAASSAFSEKMIRDNAPDKDHFGLHQIAMGSEESYGFNKNADSWPEDGLRRRHHTFVKNGHYFLEHKNTDPKFAIGIIKASAYNEDMDRVELIIHGNKEKCPDIYEMAKQGKEIDGSMSCFPGHMLVRMGDGTEKAISDINEGDKVLTHLGNVGEVQHTMSREYSDISVEFSAYGLPDPIIATKEHPIWARSKYQQSAPCPVCGIVFKRLQSHLWQKTDEQHKAARNNYAVYSENWKPAKTLIKGDLLRTPFSTQIDETGDPVYAAILGWYLAEGYVFNSTKYTKSHYCVDFILGGTEGHYAKELIDLLHQSGYTNTSVYNQAEEHSRIIVRCRNNELLERLVWDGGKLAAGKIISERVMRWSPAIQKIILEKCMEGDGDWHQKNEVAKITTVSRRLAFQLAEIGWRNGLMAYVGGDQRIRPAAMVAGHFVESFARAYTVSFNGTDIEKLRVVKIPQNYKFNPIHAHPIAHLKHQKESEVRFFSNSSKKCFIEHGFVYRQIRKITHKPLNTIVYDLTVPGDHSFTVQGIGVSNCRVKYDVCSCCGQKSASSKNYCADMKYHATQWMPKYSKFVYVRNPDPTFFDFSKVANRADRIARKLEVIFNSEEDMKKAASIQRFLFSDERATAEGIMVPDDYKQLGCINSRKQQWLEKLAAAEKTPRYDQFDLYDASDITEEQMAQLNQVYPDVLFRKLAARNIVLPLLPFTAYVTRSTLKQAAESPIYVGAKAQIANVFNTMLETEANADLEKAFCASSLFKEAHFSAGPELGKMLNKLQDDFSAEPGHAQIRIMRISITAQPHSKEERENKKEAIMKQAAALSDEQKKESNNLARAYAMYKIAYCEEMTDQQKIVDENMISLVASQH